ncbi:MULTISPECIES: tetratricopeptide repeat-containing serine protease family protein [unclassified Coleofasciculus]|uniref:tetratricopeptide repeat-containing S1 family peptidase n=1 Tax=unclassified Coleofasciculus TaxID=2692782 RepID=UPI001881E966|nr:MULTISPECIES: tetratricopeptide repeat-containing serine protease family protein [unclassified Coleofasciculus]MBE9124875.1 serine protease [Coleofasciculus sp. LEGE 07081]MBE9147881.1 serine protease [Coleofasciculus sp. LEGE 07092]
MIQTQLSIILRNATLVVVLSQVACAPKKLIQDTQPVYKIADKVTVFIDECSSGSGVIFKKQGKTYSVLTARHIVSNDKDCRVITPDGQDHSAKAGKFKRYEGLDLAVVQFESSNNYTVAKLGNSEEVSIGKIVYVAGTPTPKQAHQKTPIQVSEGEVMSTLSEERLGYAWIYNNTTKDGMNGGPLLDKQGLVIGIHGRQDRVDNHRNYGIPIQSFLTGKVSQDKKISQVKADDYLKQGITLHNQGDYQGAIAAYNQAIEVEPNNANAYISRGNTRRKLGDYQKAIADYDWSIQINPYRANAFYHRGIVRAESEDYQGAIADFDKAIEIKSNYTSAYINRGIVRYELEDFQGAIADYNRAIDIDTKEADAYDNRGIIRYQLKDMKGASADFDQAIKIDSNHINAYYNRGIARREMGDKQGAINDFEKAAELYDQQGQLSERLDALDQIRTLQAQ